ncbi:MAG: flagellar basal-body MS-ring/collar protein FliF [Gammaproteobacteria bacterium]
MAEAVALNPQASLLLLLRQAGVMVALAASVALGLYVALWARTPEYTVLYTDLSERDLSQVVDALQSNAIPYRMDANGGAILVAADKVHDARLKLAAAGLPRSAGMGFEMLEEEQGFGTSQFLEQARYQRAIEGELSRSIGHINNVRAARVHLAVPKQSAFSRTRREPTASVIVDLYNGRRLEPHQVGAIVHMVSASVPSMSPDQVTVIDQQGNLLTDAGGGSDELVLSAKRFEYTRRLEESFVERIEAILMPLVGPDGVRAQVTADVDFTTTEQTRESFNPDLPAVRSENLVEEERRGAGGAGGVPGALSNEPPAVASAPEQVAAPGADGAAAATTAEAGAPGNRRSQTTRNYELDRTISHTRPATGNVRRLSVAVVVRNPAPVAAPATAADDAAADGAADAAEEPAVVATGFDAEQLARLERLVKEAVGFDAARGDSVSVTNADFHTPPEAEPLPEPPIWQQPWVWSVGKQVLGGLFALFVLFGVIRPTVKSLMTKPLAVAGTAGEQGAARDGEVLPAGAVGADGRPAALPGAVAGQPLLASSDVDPSLDQVKQFVSQDPKIAAQVIKGWVGGE